MQVDIQRLKAYRKAYHWTQMDLARESSVSVQTIQDIEQQRTREVSRTTAERLAKALKVDLTAILLVEADTGTIVLTRKDKKIYSVAKIASTLSRWNLSLLLEYAEFLQQRSEEK